MPEIKAIHTIIGLVYHAPHLRLATFWSQIAVLEKENTERRTKDRKVWVNLMHTLDKMDIIRNRMDSVVYV